eukprot:GSMAST32.ASY1.ANO1.1318.1 assembled CDS
MIAWPKDKDDVHKTRNFDDSHKTENNVSNKEDFVYTLKVALSLKKAVVVVKNPELFPNSDTQLQGSIDIWWIVHDGDKKNIFLKYMLLLLSYLLQQHRIWRGCTFYMNF